MKRLLDKISSPNVDYTQNVLSIAIKRTKTYAIAKLNNANTFYKESRVSTDLNDLISYQTHINKRHKTLKDLQTQQQGLTSTLGILRSKQLELQDKLHVIRRLEDPVRYMQLVQQETECAIKERELSSALSNLQPKITEANDAFTEALRTNQEKQRALYRHLAFVTGTLILCVGTGTYCIVRWRSESFKTTLRKTIAEANDAKGIGWTTSAKQWISWGSSGVTSTLGWTYSGVTSTLGWTYSGVKSGAYATGRGLKKTVEYTVSWFR